MHETNDDLTKRAEQVHLELGEKYGWIKINANRTMKDISDEIFDRVNLIYNP